MCSLSPAKTCQSDDNQHVEDDLVQDYNNYTRSELYQKEPENLMQPAEWDAKNCKSLCVCVCVYCCATPNSDKIFNNDKGGQCREEEFTFPISLWACT